MRMTDESWIELIMWRDGGGYDLEVSPDLKRRQRQVRAMVERWRTSGWPNAVASVALAYLMTVQRLS